MTAPAHTYTCTHARRYTCTCTHVHAPTKNTHRWATYETCLRATMQHCLHFGHSNGARDSPTQTPTQTHTGGQLTRPACGPPCSTAYTLVTQMVPETHLHKHLHKHTQVGNLRDLPAGHHAALLTLWSVK